ncbi:aspartate aminotransferase family protein [Sessilibacter corallicola]|uniref:Acetylornithine aminotransferase n=1 Tax=Sessilibacter corallicola TaxID=2904075 RepID=A0ABQ0A3Z6_9GAMM
MDQSALMNTYGPRAVKLVKGDGCYLWDDQGKRYLDALSGIAVCGLGHNHSDVTAAITEQANTLLHTSNLFGIESQERLGQRLREISGMDKVFFSNSGAEANEAAIKIARKYGHSKGIDDPTIITMSGSFHGRTMATLTATGNTKVKQGFAPYLSGFVHAPYNDVEAVEKLVASNANVVAILVEPIQGEGGINIPANDYLSRLRTLCDQNGLLLILDEIQTGNGRTGKYFAYQWDNFLPDVVTTAKGLGNGLPIGACLARAEAAEVLQPGNHGSTFGGNPFCTQVADTVVKSLTENGLLDNVIALGNHFKTRLEDAFRNSDKVKEIRVKGLLVGIELSGASAEVVPKALEKGLIVNATAGNVVRLLPPLVMSQEQADFTIDTLIEIINAM